MGKEIEFTLRGYDTIESVLNELRGRLEDYFFEEEKTRWLKENKKPKNYELKPQDYSEIYMFVNDEVVESVFKIKCEIIR